MPCDLPFLWFLFCQTHFAWISSAQIENLNGGRKLRISHIPQYWWMDDLDLNKRRKLTVKVLHIPNYQWMEDLNERHKPKMPHILNYDNEQPQCLECPFFFFFFLNIMYGMSHILNHWRMEDLNEKRKLRMPCIPKNYWLNIPRLHPMRTVQNTSPTLFSQRC